MDRYFDHEAFHQWLEYNASSGSGEPLTVHPFFALAATSSTPVVTNGVLTGPNANQALQLDDAYTSEQPFQRLSKLQQSPVTGCAMIMTLARQKSGYNPTTPAAVDSARGFSSYVDQILKCPLFSTVLNDHISPKFSGSWPRVIDHIIRYYKGVSSSDIDIMRRSLTEIGAAASSSPSTNETMNVFSQATLNAGSEIDVYMYHTYVQMKTTVHDGGKHEPDEVHNQAKLSLYRVQLRFNSSEWPAQAAQVQNKTDQSLRGWLRGNSTPRGTLETGWSSSFGQDSNWGIVIGPPEGGIIRPR